MQANFACWKASVNILVTFTPEGAVHRPEHVYGFFLDAVEIMALRLHGMSVPGYIQVTLEG